MPRSLPPGADEAKGLRYDPGAIMTTSGLRSALVLLAVLAAMTGCTRYYWTRAGATPEHFAGDNQGCVQQAAISLPAGAAVEAIEQFYRACLQSRGYVRETHVDPPPPGFFRGLEDSEEFDAAVQAALARAPRQTFEQQLAHLDDLKARGRITEDEYAAMRKRLVDGATPAALAPAPPVIAAPRPLAGRWYGRGNAVLDIRVVGGRRLEWEWEVRGERVTTRAFGTGTVSGDRVSLSGYGTSAGFGAAAPYRFTLTHDGMVLRGTSHGPRNLPVAVEFRRERR
jgi:hypothetical protein